MTIEQPNSAKLKPENNKASPQDIGLIFAREYYTFLNRKPNRLHAFYGADSLLVRGDEGEFVPMIKGQEEIRKKIEELDFDNCKVLVTQVDSQVSANEGVLISVLGEITNKDQPFQKFSETFFLAPQPNGYYVLNNIFRFLKDKVDINYYSCEEEDDHQQQQQVKEVKVEDQVNFLDVPKINGKFDKVDKSINPNEEVKPSKVIDIKEVIEDTNTANITNSYVDNNIPTTTTTTTATTTIHPVIPVEINKQHYYKEMSNSYSRDQRGYQENGDAANKSWASLTAGSLDESIDVMKSPPPQQQHQHQQQQHYYTNQKPKVMNQQNYTSSIHMLNNVPQGNNYNMNQSQNHQQPRPHHPQQQQQQNQPSMQYNRPPYQNHNKDQRIKDTQIFVKHVITTMTEEQLENAFNQFGPIKTVSIGQTRNCAFIDFLSIESTQRALEQRKVVVGEYNVVAEERRPPKNYRQYDNNNNNNRRFQQNRRGSGGTTSGVTPNKRGTTTIVANNTGQK